MIQLIPTPLVKILRFMINTNDYKDDDGKGFVIIIKKHDKILCCTQFKFSKVRSTRRVSSTHLEEVQTKDE